MPYIPTETLVGAALLVVLILGARFYPVSGTPPPPSFTPDNPAKSGKKKQKKKSKGEVKSIGDSAVKPPTDDVDPPKSDLGGPNAEDKPEQKKKMLAERLLPKDRKTRVDDMIAPEDRPPSIARVMRVTPSSHQSQNSPKKAWAQISPVAAVSPAEPVVSPSPQEVAMSDEDFANTPNEAFTNPVVAPKDDEWDVVAPKKKKPMSFDISSPSHAKSQSTALPLPVSTKGQKKNAKKAEMMKTLREAEEADRIKRLALHRKNLERERINEIYSSQSKSKGTRGTPTGSKASVTANGKLVWD